MARIELSCNVRDAWRVSKSERTLLCLRRSLVIFKMQVAMKRTREVICSISVIVIVFIIYFIVLVERHDGFFLLKKPIGSAVYRR